MKTIKVIGDGHSATLVAEQIKRLKEIDPTIEIVVDDPHTETTQPMTKEPLTITIESMPRLKELFYPKRKHSPKGHERPYRYHP